MSSEQNNSPVLWKEPVIMWAMLAASLAMLIYIAFDGLSFMVGTWERREEYSHGYLIPVITAFLIWQKNDELRKIAFTGSWLGVAGIVFGVLIIFLGSLGAISTLMQYGFLIAVISAALAIMGMQGFKKILVPLLILAFMIPLPGFILLGLSSELQLISSKIGVAVIRLFDISVYLEGNVIDLGSYKLQVVEACSGLNYLFPLMSLSFVVAYFYQAPLWKRAVIFLSSVPVTILMNSFRIGVIGVLVEYWGSSQAEGFLHDFEGWIIFMACMGILFLEMWLLNMIGKESKPLREVFGLEFPEPPGKDVVASSRSIPQSFIGAVVIMALASVTALALDKNENIIPDRKTFAEFPMQVNDWKGKQSYLESIYLDALKLDDYILSDYTSSADEKVNFYVAYYETQQAGEAAHSPRTCIPGGGWRIKDHSQKSVPVSSQSSASLMVNRLLIQKGEHRQIVYYWFKVGDRHITSEYFLKLYLIWSAISNNRTDMALVRYTTISNEAEDIALADERLTRLLSDMYPELNKFIPD